MIDQGLAIAEYSSAYFSYENIARKDKKGIWNTDFLRPILFRSGDWKELEADAKSNRKCIFKGDIDEDEKFYYAPWSKSYEHIEIDESAGEHWFCSEDEAHISGWQAKYSD